MSGFTSFLRLLLLLIALLMGGQATASVAPAFHPLLIRGR